jgi:hypothetical protein
VPFGDRLKKYHYAGCITHGWGWGTLENTVSRHYNRCGTPAQNRRDVLRLMGPGTTLSYCYCERRSKVLALAGEVFVEP